MADELAAVLVVAHEPLMPAHVLVQPDRVQVVAAQIPEALHTRPRVIGEGADAALLCGRKQVMGEVGPLQRLLESLVRRGRVLPLHVAPERLGLSRPPALLGKAQADALCLVGRMRSQFAST